jgi:hypothetical protein
VEDSRLTANRDQGGIEITIEFVPTITATAEVHQAVKGAFSDQGLRVSDYERPTNELDAERRYKEGKWASPSLTVHLLSDLPVDEVVDKLTLGVGVALGTIRRQVPDLPFGVAFNRPDGSIHLAFRYDDGPDEMANAMEQLPVDLASRRSLGWDRGRGIWFDL